MRVLSCVVLAVGILCVKEASAYGSNQENSRQDQKYLLATTTPEPYREPPHLPIRPLQRLHTLIAAHRDPSYYEDQPPGYRPYQEEQPLPPAYSPNTRTLGSSSNEGFQNERVTNTKTSRPGSNGSSNVNQSGYTSPYEGLRTPSSSSSSSNDGNPPGYTAYGATQNERTPSSQSAGSTRYANDDQPTNSYRGSQTDRTSSSQSSGSNDRSNGDQPIFPNSYKGSQTDRTSSSQSSGSNDRSNREETIFPNSYKGSQTDRTSSSQSSGSSGYSSGDQSIFPNSYKGSQTDQSSTSSNSGTNSQSNRDQQVYVNPYTNSHKDTVAPSRTPNNSNRDGDQYGGYSSEGASQDRVPTLPTSPPKLTPIGYSASGSSQQNRAPSLPTSSPNRYSSGSQSGQSLYGHSHPSHTDVHNTDYTFGKALSVIKASNALGVNLMKYLIRQNENTIMAPFSLSFALGMLYFASAGNTKAQLSRTLNYDRFKLDDAQLQPAFKTLTDAAKRSEDQGFSLEWANYLFTKKGLNTSESFKQIVKESFGASVEEIDFQRTTQALRKMNGLMSKKTKGLISNPIDSIDRDSRVMLVNAIYFKGFWEHPFSVGSSFDSTFANDGVDDAPVRMMYMRNHFLMKALPEIDAQALQLPYEGEETIMLIVLPNEKTGVDRMLQRINVEKIVEDLPTYRNFSLDLHIPKFEVKQKYKLKQQLQELGLTDMFKAGKARLPEIDSNNYAVVNDVIHEARIKVDERGTEASAVTTVAIINYSGHDSFTVRHPFVFFVIHKPTGAVLFSGKILRIEEGESVASPPPQNYGRYHPLGKGR